MEHIGFLQIIKLIRPPDKIARDENTVGKAIEKHVIGDEAGHRHNAPTRRRHQPFGQFGKIGNAGLR